MADYRFIDSAGVIVADTAKTRAQVEEEFKAVFGQDLVVDPATPQGALITRITEERDSIARNNAQLANQINPDIAGGVFLDALWRLTAGDRRAPVKTLITGVELRGVPATIIPQGSIATSSEGDEFELTSTKVLDDEGEATGTFRAVEHGPIRVAPHGLDTIASNVLGWETVDNPTAALPGTEEESDAGARRRRRLTLALQTTSTNEAIISRLYGMEEVRSINYIENYDSAQQTIDGITLKPHSIWVCVEGATNVDIARALMETKTIGGGYNGDIEVTITEPISGRPYPVKFDRPDEIEVSVKVTVSEGAFDMQALIPELVERYADGEVDGDISFVVGVDVSPWEIAGAINQQEPAINVRRVEVKETNNGGDWSRDVFSVAADEVARLANVVVVVE